MLSKVATTWDEDFVAGVSALSDFVAGGTDDVTAEGLESIKGLYKHFVPNHMRYEGEIWRGVNVGVGDRYIIRFFKDNRFVLADYRSSQLIESWTKNEKIAEGFATTATPVGAVVQSHTDQFEVVMQLDRQILKKLNQQKRIHPNYKRDLSKYAYEEEIMVENPGARKYTLCQDVQFVVVDEILLEADFPKGYSAFLERLDAKSRDKVENYQLDEKGLYECQGDGTLKRLRRKPQRLKKEFG